MNLININNTKEYLTKDEFYSVISDLKQSILDGFDRIFKLIDDTKAELRSEMNQRFLKVDKRFNEIDNRFIRVENKLIDIDERLINVENKIIDIDEKLINIDERVINIENNMVHKHELDMV